MAKGRRVVGDQNSEELDQLRRCVHTLLLVLSSVATQIGDAANAAAISDIADGLANAIDTGVDSDVSGYTGTGLALEGVIPTPQHPRRPNVGKVENLDPKNL